MRINVLKIGARIAFNANDTSAGNGEARCLVDILHSVGADIHIYTKILNRDILVNSFSWHDIENSEIPNEGVLLVFNGNINFFGGEENRLDLLNYKYINNFKGKIFYLYSDTDLTLRQCWGSVEKKSWGSKWDRQDIEITRDDITYISQGSNTQAILNRLKEKSKYGIVVPENVVHFPIEKFPLISYAQLEANLTPQVDLIYGGTMRGGKREKKMIEYFFDHPEDINVEMFGKINPEKFSEKNISKVSRFPVFSGPVKFNEFPQKLNSSIAHMVIGDPIFASFEHITCRVYESIRANVVTFIHSEMDPIHKVYGDSEIGKFLYIDNKEQLINRIRMIKKSTKLWSSILDFQKKKTQIDSQEYGKELLRILSE
jgi:hypothetical protein